MLSLWGRNALEALLSLKRTPKPTLPIFLVFGKDKKWPAPLKERKKQRVCSVRSIFSSRVYTQDIYLNPPAVILVSRRIERLGYTKFWTGTK